MCRRFESCQARSNANDRALERGERLSSSCEASYGKVWIITERLTAPPPACCSQASIEVRCDKCGHEEVALKTCRRRDGEGTGVLCDECWFPLKHRLWIMPTERRRGRQTSSVPGGLFPFLTMPPMLGMVLGAGLA